MDKNKLIDNIVLLEWKQFQATQNEGGRASCQDDFETFNIMRQSQYLAWYDDVTESYYNDLLTAESKPWNLVTEKYARMMESTAPEEYKNLADKLPKLSPERIEKQEQIISKRVKWEEDFAKKFPALHDTARPIHTSQDTQWETSFETYARGEISTFSDKTVDLYLKMVEDMDSKGQNLSEITVLYMVKFYGYESLEKANERYEKEND